MPSSDNNQNNPSPTLYDTLPLTRRINIFTSLLLQDHPSLPSLLQVSSANDNDRPTNFTILAPLNSALQSLPHKPWEDSQDYTQRGERAYDGEDGQERARGNLKRFVEGHVVGRSPWGRGEKVKTVGGREVWWEERQQQQQQQQQGGDEKNEEGKMKKRVVMPDVVEVDEVVSQAGNGEVWVLKGVLKV